MILPRFERRLCRRNRFSGGGFGRGAEPPSESVRDAGKTPVERDALYNVVAETAAIGKVSAC
jgi:hypothetical protein